MSRPQVEVLRKLADVPHVVKLAGEGQCTLDGKAYRAFLVEPFVQLLSQEDPVEVFAQVRWWLVL